MSNFTITLEIPALDRLCAALEDRMIRTVEDCIREELTQKPAFKEVPPAEDHPWKDEAKAAPEPRNGPQEPPKPEPSNVPSAPAAPAPDPAPAATLEAVQRAAAQLRDAGKIKAVTALFPEFGIVKLSDLKPEQLATFAERLRGMGAKL